MAPPAHRDAPRHCPSCGHRPESAAAAWSLLGELETLWLTLTPAGTVVSSRFCRACAPAGPVTELACTRCADGPLLHGQLARPAARGLVEQWLRAQGWIIGDATTCPACLPRRSADRFEHRPGRRTAG
jgi:hypothetical protein